MNKAFAIFDMDGTLVDSMPWWQRIGVEYLAANGVTNPPAELLERIKPMTLLESSALFMREFRIPGSPEEIAAEINGLMAEHYRRDVTLKPGAAEFLRALNARGVRMCVASATVEPLVTACLGRLGVLDCFEFLISCADVGAGKDRPDVFLAAAERFGAAPKDVAVYEDAIFAAQTAVKAGFYTVGVYDATADAAWEQLKAITREHITDWKEAANEL